MLKFYSPTVVKRWLFAAVSAGMLLGACATNPKGTAPLYGNFTGQYALPPHGIFNIRVHHGKLVCRFTHQEYFELLPMGGGNFKTLENSTLSFQPSSGGKVDGLIWRQDGKSYQAKKISDHPLEEGTREVSAGGGTYRVRVQGTGRPVVVMESTLGGALETWKQIQPAIARFSTVLCYDRAGLGLSSPRRSKRDGENISSELHALLRKLELPPPYVLVGYSAGGAYVRIFAGKFTNEVAGLVLVEPSQLEFERWVKTHEPEDYARSTALAPGNSPGFNQHLAVFPEVLAQAEQRQKRIPDIPITLLTGMRIDPGEEKKRPLWLEAHRHSLARFSHARHIISEKSAHGIVSNEPELIIKSITDMLENYRAGAALK